MAVATFLLSSSTLLLVAFITSLSLLLFFITNKHKASTKSSNLPPGSFGWPILGETLSLLRSGWDGTPEIFVRERMVKHHPEVFKTWLLGEPVAVLCGAGGNKFLFSNENKLVVSWWPSSVRKLFQNCLINTVGDEAKRMRKVLLNFLDPDALMKRYITTMDVVTQQHITAHWHGKEEIKVYPTIKFYTFELACRLFMSLEDPIHITELAYHFNIFTKGVIDIPLNIPGTKFYRTTRAASAIRKQLRMIVRERRVALDHRTVSPSQDLLSHLLVTGDENGMFLTEAEIVNTILLLLYAGHDTSSTAITLTMKTLGEFPEVYEKVLREQSEIAASKESGELLQWEDIQKMRYSWNVVSEVMRLSPPVNGAFREAIVDFNYAGYTIPKGWKLYWSAASTHKDPNFFSNATRFDASRFEGGGPTPFSYVPFGGGPRMCLGKEYARLEILIFLHNVVRRFRWDLLVPDEKMEYDPMPTPVKGLPIHLLPHKP